MARPRKNNADYFSHDNNMRNHRKIKVLRNTFGIEGYAIFNMFLETLAESDNFKIRLKTGIDWDVLASDFVIETDILKKILFKCCELELLENKSDYFWSTGLIERMQPVLDLREKKRLWAEKRWNNDVLENENEVLDAEKYAKESKVKESKLNISKDINSLSSLVVKNKTPRDFLNARRKEVGKEPMKSKLTLKQVDFFKRSKLVDHFKEAVNQEHSKNYFTHPDDIKDIKSENSKISKLLKEFFVRCDGDIKKAKSVIDFWASGYGQDFWNYKPQGCFRKDTIVDFENKTKKPKYQND